MLQTPNLDLSEGYPCLSWLNSLIKNPGDELRWDIGIWNKSDIREAGQQQPDIEKGVRTENIQIRTKAPIWKKSHQSFPPFDSSEISHHRYRGVCGPGGNKEHHRGEKRLLPELLADAHGDTPWPTHQGKARLSFSSLWTCNPGGLMQEGVNEDAAPGKTGKKKCYRCVSGCWLVKLWILVMLLKPAICYLLFWILTFVTSFIFWVLNYFS